MQQLRYSVFQDEIEFDVEVTVCDRRAAYIRCERNGNRVVIADLFVQQSLQLPWPLFPRLLVKIFGTRKPISIRGRGIGRELLSTLLAYAQATDVMEISGDVVATDAAETPHLLSLYEQHGFVLSEPAQDSVRGTIKRVIWKRLACDVQIQSSP